MMAYRTYVCIVVSAVQGGDFLKDRDTTRGRHQRNTPARGSLSVSHALGLPHGPQQLFDVIYLVHNI